MKDWARVVKKLPFGVVAGGSLSLAALGVLVGSLSH